MLEAGMGSVRRRAAPGGPICLHTCNLGVKSQGANSGDLGGAQWPVVACGCRPRRERRLSTWELQSEVGAGLSRRRMGCCCKGYAWISPCMRTLQFCVYW